MSSCQSIDFQNYRLTTNKNILTAKPKNPGSPAVTVNLNEVVGVQDGALKLGRKMFSKHCQKITIVEQNGINYLSAYINDKSGRPSDEPYLLKLDGALSITIPKEAAKTQESELCEFPGLGGCAMC